MGHCPILASPASHLGIFSILGPGNLVSHTRQPGGAGAASAVGISLTY